MGLPPRAPRIRRRRSQPCNSIYGIHRLLAVGKRAYRHFADARGSPPTEPFGTPGGPSRPIRAQPRSGSHADGWILPYRSARSLVAFAEGLTIAKPATGVRLVVRDVDRRQQTSVNSYPSLWIKGRLAIAVPVGIVAPLLIRHIREISQSPELE